MNLKLKTRIFIEEDHVNASRCAKCNSILINSISSADNVSILE